jgi:phage tail sheath protein FI
MPEYLAPGVYVEETSFRAKSIEGVSTTTTGFIGPTRYGPIDIEPELITSLVEFERMFGDRQKLDFADAMGTDNYMWHGARAFFEEGGKRLYVTRTFRPSVASSALSGFAHGAVGHSPPAFQVQARFPGVMGNRRVTFTLKAGQNLFSRDPSGVNRLQGVADRDVVWVRHTAVASPPLGLATGYYLLLWDAPNQKWRFGHPGDTAATASADLQAAISPDTEIRVITLTVAVAGSDANTATFVAADLPLDPAHQRAGTPDSAFAMFAAHPASLNLSRTLPIVLAGLDAAATGVDVLEGLFAADPTGVGSPPIGLRAALENPRSPPDQRSIAVSLTGGDDGVRPTADEYEGTDDPDSSVKTGLKQFEDLEDISIVAAPGSTFGLSGAYADQARAITLLLIAHAETMRYRIAVLDSGDGQSLSEVRAFRAKYDSSYAALYYPWIRILDPITQREISMPPSGFVAGMYCRNDVNRAVYKAPANEVVNLALGFETFLNKSQQDVLNPEGINCFRFFEGRGMRLWGARTISSDPEWKYVNLRRYFAYLEHSIDLGTQWAVFEPNGDLLWGNVRRTIEDFLLNEWHNGALLGDQPSKAFFVKCDRSTMSQNDLDNGRLVCLIGVAPLRPAEFVILRIGQWTGDRKI